MRKINNILRKIYEYIKQIQDDDISIYAASLSFYTIFSLVPLIFVFFTIFLNLPAFQVYYEKVKNLILSNLLPAHQKEAEVYLYNFLKGIDNLGALSVSFIIITSILFFHNFEHIVSKIVASRKRNLVETFTTYWTLITLSPLGISLSFYFSSFFSSKIKLSFYNYLVSFLFTWGVFFVMYLVAAGKSLRLKYIFLVSLFTSILWYIGKILFIAYAVHNKAYTTIYGSFSIIFFFFIWIYISWYIYLYGLKIAYILSKKELYK